MRFWGRDWLQKEFRSAWRLFGEFTPFRRQVTCVVLLGLVISAVQPVAVRLSQRIVDELQRGVNTSLFNQIPLFLVLTFVVSGLAKYFHNTIRRTLAEHILLKLRTALFRKYLFLPIASIDNRRTGEMLSGIQNDLAQIGVGIDTIAMVMKEPFTFVGLIGIAFYCDWRLTLATMLVLPFVVYLFSRSGSAVKRYSTKNLSLFSDLLSLGQESITGSRVVKVFRLEAVLLEKFKRIQDAYFKTIVKSIRVQELGTPLVELIGALLMAGVLLYGGYRVSDGDLTVGRLVAFLLSLGLAQMPIKNLNNAWLKLRAAEAAAERVYGMLDAPDTLDAPTARTAGVALRLEHGIRYEGIGMRYDEKRALDGVSFGIKRGDCLALVGSSGSGKTTLVNLLPRLYDPDRGRILIDGTDIREFSLEELRGLISFVTQDTFLFNDSIYENIRYGKPSATATDIEEAASLAHCIDFIARAPEGFDTRIGDRGVCLSGGERQRIAIARAILKGAPILILDEATSSLDSNSEALVQSALDELMEGKTTLLVAHRFSTILRANRILVMDRGKIREEGTHGELLARRGTYRELFDRQSLAGAPAEV